MAFTGVSMMLAILLRRYFRYQGRLNRERRREANKGGGGAAARFRSHRDSLEAPKEVTQWEVRFHETCRDIQAELDSKMVALQVLIRDANAAAERLEKAKNGD
jgi:hypothetical protein